MVAFIRSCSIPVVALSVILPAQPLDAHLDAGACLATTEVVLDHVNMISTDEPGQDGPGGREEVRIYTNVATVGHRKQESFFAFADDQYGGLTKEEYDKAEEDGEENPYGDQPIVGHTIYYHINCLPHEPFNMDFEMWDDDSWDLDEILETIKKILDLPGMPAEAKVWGGIGVAIGELASELSQASRDNHSKAEIRGKHYANGQHTEPGTMRCCNDGDWENGDHSADFVFTVKKESAGACTLENWESAMEDFITQLEAETHLEKKLQAAYENLLKKVRDREETKKKAKKNDVSRGDIGDALKSLEEAVATSRAEVDAVLVEAAHAWTGPEDTIPVRQFQDLSKLEYWADETEAIDGIPLVTPEQAATCPEPEAAAPPPRTAQVTFSSIEAGDRITLSDQYVRGTATVTFTATEEGESEPKTEIGREDDYAVIAFAGALGAAAHLVVSGDDGGAVDITKGPTEPAVVSGGRGSFVFESGPDNPVTDVGVSEEGALDAQSDWVASLERADGSVEAAYDVVGLPFQACGDGEIDFALERADGTSSEIARSAICVSYRMEQTTRVGESVRLQATIAGLEDDATVRFTFTPDPVRILIEPLSVTLTAGEINDGAPLATVTSQVPGSHAFDITVKLVEE